MARNRKHIMSLTPHRKDPPADSQSKANKSDLPTHQSFDLDCTYIQKQKVDNYSSSVRPKTEQQISVLSTDSGFLPKDIQDSSFVDDVIDELNSKGICHYDLISSHDCPQSNKPEKQLHMDKSAVMKDLPCDTETSSKKKPRMELDDKSKRTNARRLKNNESSRRSRASRKETTQLKEVEVTNLEAENRRLSILLSDFNAIAANCKQWIVKKMESSDE